MALRYVSDLYEAVMYPIVECGSPQSEPTTWWNEVILTYFNDS